MLKHQNDLHLYHGCIAIQRDGLIGIVMDHEGHNKLVVDGENVHVDDARVVPNAADESAIMALAAELGHDLAAQKAIAESVRLLRSKQAAKLPRDVAPIAHPFLPPVSPDDDPALVAAIEAIANADVRTMDLNSKRVRTKYGVEGTIKWGKGEWLQFLEDGNTVSYEINRSEIISVITGEEAPAVPDAPAIPANFQSIIDSLRAENNLLHRENDKLKAAATDSDDVAGLRRELEIAKTGRLKAEAAIEEALALKVKADNAAMLADFELRKLRNNIPTPSPISAARSDSTPHPASQGGELKPIEVKVLANTLDKEFERLWANGWMLFHTQFSPEGACQTVWRKDNKPVAPTEPMNVEAVALPTFDNTSMEFDAGEAVEFVTLQDADLEIFGAPVPSVNAIPTPDPVSAAQSDSTPHPASQGGETEVIEIEPTDLFPHFDTLETIIKDMPIASALLKHGPEKVNAAFDEMERRAFLDAVEKSPGMKLANRIFTQLGEGEREKV